VRLVASAEDGVVLGPVRSSSVTLRTFDFDAGAIHVSRVEWEGLWVAMNVLSNSAFVAALER